MENRYLDQIEPYLDGSLDAQEHEAFTNALKKDPALMKEVAFQRQLINGLKKSTSNMNKKQLRHLWEEVKREQQISRRKLWRNLLAAAAAVAGILIVAGRLFSPTVDNLAGQYFEPYPVDILRDGSPDENEVLLFEASQAYRQQNYARALSLFEKVKVNPPADQNILLYKGICHFQLKEFQLAGPLFRQLVHQSLLWDEHGRWYLALTCLSEGNLEEARSLLKIIGQTENHFRKKESLEILQKID